MTGTAMRSAELEAIENSITMRSKKLGGTRNKRRHEVRGIRTSESASNTLKLDSHSPPKTGQKTTGSKNKNIKNPP
jgi:hypothetical protein